MTLIKIILIEKIFLQKIHNNEAIFLCLDCIEKMRNYISEDKPYFFYETKKNLIEYYIPIGESTRRLKIERSI